MTAELKQPEHREGAAELLQERQPVRRTPAEKARILARLTAQLAALDQERDSQHGNA